MSEPLFRRSMWFEGDELVHRLEQPSRELILDTNREMRKAEPMADRPGLGRWALSVPLEDWQALRAKYPDLASRDPQISSRAWLAFMQSSEAEPYKVRDSV